MAINNIEIKNFTVFMDVNINFSKGVNVFIGENGTGKTHLLKILYGNHHSNVNKSLNQYFSGYDQNVFTDDENHDIVVNMELNGNVVFIPAKDMLTHSKGFMSLYDNTKIAFDKTYFDIVSKALLPEARKIPEIAKAILPALEKIMNGKVVVENDTFYIEKSNGKKIEFSVEAEGIKKAGLLWQLLMNESITKGTILLWDEPEANINPNLIPDIVEILLELSRQGVQIFAATHDYIFAKYFEVKCNPKDSVSFHSLYKTDSSVQCETSSNFIDLSNNSIVMAFNVLMDEVINRNLGE